MILQVSTRCTENLIKLETEKEMKNVIFTTNINAKSMNVQATKLELMKLLLDTEEESVLFQLKEVFERENAREAMIRKEMVESSERANEDIKAGRVHTPDEVEELLVKRFGT